MTELLHQLLLRVVHAPCLADRSTLPATESRGIGIFETPSERITMSEFPSSLSGPSRAAVQVVVADLNRRETIERSEVTVRRHSNAGHLRGDDPFTPEHVTDACVPNFRSDRYVQPTS